MNLAGWIDHQADFVPEKCAIRFDGQDISYAELADRINQLAAVLTLQLDVQRGDRVAYLGLNSPEIIVLLFACAKIAAVMVPLNWRLAGPEHIYLLNHAEPCALFVQPGFVEHVDNIGTDIGPTRRVTYGEAPHDWNSYDELILGADKTFCPQSDAAPDDPVLLCYTSGTTGKPKGALLTNNALVWNAANSAHMHDLTSEDVVLTLLPMFHVGGLNIQTLPALHAGATVVIHDRFEIDSFFAALEFDRFTLTLVVPTIMHTVLNDSRWESADISSLRIIGVGSTIVPEQMVLDVGARGIPLIQVYGSTETAPIAAYMPFREVMQRPGSTGKPALHCDIRLVDEGNEDVAEGQKGEILVRGPNVMTEYWNAPEATRAAFTGEWFHTEDIAHWDSEGFLYIDGRSKDMIISGGENIYPAVIENLLGEWKELSEVAVVGRPDEHWGEVVVAVLVARGSHPDVAAVRGFCEGRIAHYAIPREVLIVDELPRNAMGKVVKEEVRDMVLQRMSEINKSTGVLDR